MNISIKSKFFVVSILLLFLFIVITVFVARDANDKYHIGTHTNVKENNEIYKSEKVNHEEIDGIVEPIVHKSNSLDKLEIEKICDELGSAIALTQAKLQPRPLRGQLIEALFAYVAPFDPEFVARELNSSELTEVQKEYIVNWLINVWEDPEKSIIWATVSLDGQLQALAVSRAIGKMAILDGNRAIELFSNLPQGSTRQHALINLVDNLGKHDFKKALNFVNSFPSAVDKDAGILRLIPYWVEVDLSESKDYVSNNSGANNIGPIASIVAIKNTQTEPMQAVVWAGKLNGSAGENARRATIFTWADMDLNQVKNTVDAMAPSEQTKFAPHLASKWAQMDPQAASAWIENFKDDGLQSTMVPELLHYWSRTSMEEAMSWVSSLNGESRERGEKFIDNRILAGSGIAPSQLKYFKQENEDSSLFPQKIYHSHGNGDVHVH